MCGMIRPIVLKVDTVPSLPRMCGDDPSGGFDCMAESTFAPHMRG